MTEKDVIEGVSEEMNLVPSRFQDAAIVPIMTPDELEEQWNQYRLMENKILQEDDYVYWVMYKTGGKPQSVVCMTKKEADVTRAKLRLKRVDASIVRRKKKSAYRKMARFFGLFVPGQAVADVKITPLGDDHFVQVEKGNGVTIITYMDNQFNTIKAEVTVTTVSPSGKASVGVGVCSAEERKFAHPDHDIKATAFTRALNRSVSDLVGWGEVSAEEVLSGGEASGSKREKKVEESEVIEGEIVSEAGKSHEGDITLSAFLAKAFALGWTADRIEERFGELKTIASYKAVLETIEKEGKKKDE